MERHIAWVRVWCVGVVCVGLGAAASHAAIDALNGFGRYRVILDRRPFGELLSRTDLKTPAPAPPPELPPFTTELELCFIGEGPTGQRVGFFNTKSGEAYYLYLNQTSEDGITVTQISYRDQKALLRKGGKEHWLAMGTTTTGTGGPVAARTTRGVAARSAPQRNSDLDRLRRRGQTTRRPRLEGEDLKKYLREYQKELLRTGQPPLPMPLTGETDDPLGCSCLTSMLHAKT
jgi:hypothetical protein